MSTQRVTKILCAAEPRGNAEAVERLLVIAAERGAHAVAVVGDLATAGDRESYRAVFHALGSGGLPAFWVPGAHDAPIGDYLREAHTMEIVHPDLHGVHGTAAMAPDGHILFAGMGGHVDDDPDAPRDELDTLRYPRWEPDYRLKILNEFAEHQPVLLFSTPPAHKGLHVPGSDVLAELAATYRARLVVCGGERTSELLGRTLVVAPGSLLDGLYAVVDLEAREAEFGELTAATRA
jgi:Icc-related predicted phosphoesterase